MAESFTEIVQRHRDAMLATALRVTGRAPLAEEATQEAFIQLYRSFEELTDRDRLGPWLKVTVRRIARDMIRRERVQTSPFLAEEPSSAERPGERLQNAESTAYALTALAVLPLRDRELLLAAMIGDATNEELAKYFHTTATTIKGRLQRARERLAATGSSLTSIQNSLSAGSWPTNYAERCRLSAEARSAGVEAFWHWGKATQNSIGLLDSAPLDRAYEIYQRALALDPYSATNHAIASQLCCCIAIYQRLSELTGQEVAELKGLGDLIGTLPQEMLQQARAQAETAERLNRRDVESARATFSILIWGAKSRNLLPLKKLAKVADLARVLAPDRLDVAENILFVAALGDGEPDVEPYLRTLASHQAKPLDRGLMTVAFGAVRLMLRFSKKEAARRILAAIRENHTVLPELQDEFALQLASYDEFLSGTG